MALNGWMSPQAQAPLWLGYNRTYRIHMPHDTFVKAACEDVGCDQWLLGWETVCDLSDTSDFGGLAVATLIRSGKTGRTYREFPPAPGGTVTVFRFDSRQRCFREHRTRAGRLLVHQGGRIAQEHTSFRDIAEDYTEHVGRLADQEKRG